jgi:hypothetical protein
MIFRGSVWSTKSMHGTPPCMTKETGYMAQVAFNRLAGIILCGRLN